MSRIILKWQVMYLLLTFVLTAFTGGCAEEVGNNEANLEQFESAMSDIDPYIYELANEFWNDRIYSDVDSFNAFVNIVDNLSEIETEQLVSAIDIIVDSKTSDPMLMKSATVHVYWDIWPSGRTPSSTYVTTSCGGDNDVGIRYYSVWNAYNSPSHLWFETNNAVVYGFTSAHSNSILAYDINSSNTVSVCVGVGSSNYAYVNTVRVYFAGLKINSW